MGVFIVLLVYVLGLVTSGVFLVKVLDQRTRDRQRKTYRLAFPSDLDAERVLSWVRAFSGTLRGPRFQFTGAPSLCFEMWATNEGIVHRLKVPWQHVEYILPQLHSLVPGIHVTPEDNYPYNKHWTRAVEAKLTSTSRTLRIYSPVDTSASLLASVAALEPGETVLLQWVVTPTPPKAAPIPDDATSHKTNLWTVLNGNQANRDEVADRRKKLEEPNLVAVLRVAAIAETPVRADQLIHRVRASLAATRGPATRFIKRLLAQDTVRRRIQQSAGSVVFPIQLSATELTALIAWPIGNPFVTGLAPIRTRPLPAPGTVPVTGMVIGRSTFPGDERLVALGFEEALMHTHVLGKTGVGKSELLAHMTRQAMEHDYGLILMEREGDLYSKALNYVPRNRVNDVIVMDAADRARPVGFNILDQGNPATAIDEIIALLQHRYGREGLGIWAQEYIYHGLKTIAEHPELSFIDLAPLLNPETSEEVAWADQLVRLVRDPEIRRWWQRHENRDKRSQQQRADPVLSRMWQLVSRPEMRYIMGQSKSSFKLADVLQENKILLINFRGVPKDAASLTGTLMLNAMWHAIKSIKKTRPTYLVLDEFADFMDLPIDTESMLAQARKHKVGLILANQHMAQLKPSVRDAVVSNARSKVIFQSNANDAYILRKEIGGRIALRTEDMIGLQVYEAIVQLMTPPGSSPPMTVPQPS